MKRGRAIARVVLLGAIAVAAFLALRAREPMYQGKPLTAWLRMMESRSDWAESVQSAQAREAVVSMSSIAVPHLVTLIHRKGSGFHPGYRKFVYQRIGVWPRSLIRLLPAPLDYPYQLQMNAASALAHIGRPTNLVLLELTALLQHEYPPLREVAAHALVRLGNDAMPSLRLSLKDQYPGVQIASANSLWRIRGDVTESIPVLVRWLEDTTNAFDFRWRAAQVLGAMGPKAQPAVQALTEALKDPENFVRLNAAWALGSIGPGANSAIPALSGALDENNLAPPTRSIDFNGDWQVCAAAAKALGLIGGPPDKIVPALLTTLESSHDEIVVAGCLALARIGAESKPAVPALLRLTRLPHGDVRSAAIKALRQIDPEAAARGGAK